MWLWVCKFIPAGWLPSVFKLDSGSANQKITLKNRSHCAKEEETDGASVSQNCFYVSGPTQVFSLIWKREEPGSWLQWFQMIGGGNTDINAKITVIVLCTKHLNLQKKIDSCVCLFSFFLFFCYPFLCHDALSVSKVLGWSNSPINNHDGSTNTIAWHNRQNSLKIH